MHASGVIAKIFPDDLKGARHQKFTLQINQHKTILVIHNIDISSKIMNLRVGDKLECSGEYQWNKFGGMVHWTHKDPHGVHQAGWIKHQGKIYT